MICSKCNAENPDYYVFCQNCFADLTKGNASSAAKNPPSGEYAQNEIPGDEYDSASSSDNFYEEQDIDLSVYENASAYDEEYESSRMEENVSRSGEDVAPQEMDMVASIAQGLSPRDLRRQQKQAARDTRELEKLQTNQSAEYYDYYDYYDEAALKREKHRSKKTGTIIAAVIIVLLLALIAIGVVFANKEYGGLQNAVEAIFAGKQPVQVAPVVDKYGNPSHMLTIRGKEGDTLEFNNPEILHSEVLDTNKAIGYTIPDLSWIPDDPEPDIKEIIAVPSVSITSKNGTVTPLVVQEYKVVVPETVLIITDPVELEGNIAIDNKIKLSGQFDSGTVAGAKLYVDINGIEGEKDFLEVGREFLNEDGVFVIEVTVPPGDFEITLEARAAKSITSTVVIKGNNPSGEAAPGSAQNSGLVTFDQDIFGQSFSEPLLNLSGKTTPNSSFTVSGTTGDVEYDPATGVFSFAARIPQEGFNEFDIKVGDATEHITIRRLPTVNDFFAAAKPLDYKYALANPNEAFKKEVKFDATVIEIVETSPKYIMKMQMDNSTDIVEVTYFGFDKPQLNEHFKVIARTIGTGEQNTQLRVNAYYMYRDDDIERIKVLQEAAAANPAPAPTE